MRVLFLLIFTASPAFADHIAANSVIRPKQIISVNDLQVLEGDVASAYQEVSDLIGKEAKLLIARGRPILQGYVSEPALVERNDLVEIVYQTNSLTIKVEGRSLSRGAIGEKIRVMNLSSRTTVFGTVADDGRILVR